MSERQRPSAKQLLRGSRSLLSAMLVLGASGLASHSALALPAFARQTGAECAACHVGAFGPQLTTFGKQFKLGGYTLTDGKSGHVPLSAMLVGTFTSTDEKQPVDPGPHEDSNNNTSLQEASVFLAGRITDHLGSFVQATYSDISRDTALDNFDVRYAHNLQLGGKNTILGVSVNNNPTVSDVQNTVPAWRFPYMASELVPGPLGSPLIDGGLEGQVIGASAYAMWGDSIYGEIGGYRSLSSSFLDDVNVDDEAGKLGSLSPYWRLSYSRELAGGAFTAGLFGLDANLHPGRAPGRSDKYQDVGVDASYQFVGDRKNIYTLNTSYVDEQLERDGSVQLGDAQSPNGNVQRFDLSASWFRDQTWGLTAAVFDISGDRDPTLYAPDVEYGSRKGSTDTTGLTLQADWTPFGKEDSWRSPWANLRLGVQYTMYDKFNGASSNYDGFGRDASDNNTLFLFAWTAF
jgi:hypothetical protein